jgi:hypothetical protein
MISNNPPLTVAERRCLARAATPLWLVFWGTVFIVLSINLGIQIGDRRASVDILPDALGYLLVAAGTCLFSFGNYLWGPYELVMTVVMGLSIGGGIASIIGWVVPEALAFEGLSSIIATLLTLVGSVGFCICMSAFSDKYHLRSLSRRWSLLAVLALVCWSIPRIIVWLLFRATDPSGTPVPVGALLLVLGAVPLTYFGITMVRMARLVKSPAGRSM